MREKEEKIRSCGEEKRQKREGEADNNKNIKV